MRSGKRGNKQNDLTIYFIDLIISTHACEILTSHQKPARRSITTCRDRRCALLSGPFPEAHLCKGRRRSWCQLECSGLPISELIRQWCTPNLLAYGCADPASRTRDDGRLAKKPAIHHPAFPGGTTTATTHLSNCFSAASANASSLMWQSSFTRDLPLQAAARSLGRKRQGPPGHAPPHPGGPVALFLGMATGSVSVRPRPRTAWPFLGPVPIVSTAHEGKTIAGSLEGYAHFSI